MLRICQTCDQLHASGTRCPTTERRINREREVTSPSRAQGQYDGLHRKRALALRNQRLPCSICGGQIDYALRKPDPGSFVAHHLTQDKRGPIAAAHRRCNERAGKPRA